MEAAITGMTSYWVSRESRVVSCKTVIKTATDFRLLTVLIVQL